MWSNARVTTRVITVNGELLLHHIAFDCLMLTLPDYHSELSLAFNEI
jgi:hypothetical protein